MVVTLAVRSCVARQEPYIPGALSILQGTVPGRVRGSGHMVPTYFRRELRDRALQRPSWLRTFVFLLLPDRHPSSPATRLRLRLRRASVPVRRSFGEVVFSMPRLRGSITSASEYWITRSRGG